jgi:pyruvate formate lyase activating enzyme
VVVSTYNEPLITIEWAVEVFQRARAAGLKTAFVSNGNTTPEAMDYLAPWIDAYKVDLKSMNGASYRRLGGVRDHVLDSIRALRDRGIWLEVVTLVVPDFHDDEHELREAAEFLADVSRDIPWHVTAFHPQYRMRETPTTEADALMRAMSYAEEAGLRHIYPGNLPGRVGRWEDTRCPACASTLVRRNGFQVLENRLADDRTSVGRCPDWETAIPGLWA